MIRFELGRSAHPSLRCFLHGHGQPTTQRHAPERFSLFSPIHAHEPVEGLAEVDDRRNALGVTSFGSIQATLNDRCASFILEPRQPGKRIKAEPIALLHAGVPRRAASMHRSPSPTRGVLAIPPEPVMVAFA
jgi:hypothetical protein